MTTTVSESVVLRAEAAVFVFKPSCNFALASTTATGDEVGDHGSNSQHQHSPSHSNNNNNNNNNNRNNKNRNKGKGSQKKPANHQCQQDDDDDEKTKTGDRSNPHNERNHHRRRPRQQRPQKKQHNQGDHKAKGKPSSVHNSNKNKKTRRRLHGDKIINNTNKTKTKTNDCIVVANNNHVVDHWNYDIYGNELEHIPPSSDLTTVSPVLNSSSPSSIWYEVSVRDIPSIVREQEGGGEEKINTASASKSTTTKEKTWCNGLQLLTSRREASISTNSDKYDPDETTSNEAIEEKQVGSNKENDGREEEKKHLGSCDVSTESVAGMMMMTTTTPNKRIDISRLRDRWWTAVAEQRLQREFRAELEEKLALVRILVGKNDVDHCVIELVHKEPINNVEDSRYNHKNDSGHGENIYDKSISDRISTCSSSENEDVYLSALDHYEKINNASSLSTKKLLECIVEQSDDRALRELLELSWIKSDEKQELHDHFCIATDRISSSKVLDKENGPGLVDYAIEVAIRQDKPQILRTILSVTSGRVPIDTASKRYGSPLIQTVELGHEECASILLSTQDRGSTLLFLKDIDGNTALHYCCREKGDKSILLMLLKQAIGNTKGKRQQFSKLVTARNKNMQTPLHLACQCGRDDLVEVFLTTCKSSLLFKIFSTTDIDNRTPLLTAVANNSCDVVVSLIMWRGNHSLHGPSVNNDSGCSQTKKALLTCPLVCAAHNGNLDMIDLLVQFENHSGTVVYHVTEALPMLLRSDAPLHNKVKGSDILIHAGGNPFEEIDLSSVSSETETTIEVAARVGPDVILRSVISAGRRILRNRQLSRRNDPKLQQQPDAFFRILESKEDSEANSAMKNALIAASFRAYTKQKALDFSAAIVLYEEMPKVDDTDLTRLQTSMLHEKFTYYKPEIKNYCFLATFEHSFCADPVYKGSKSSFLDYDRSVLAEKSFRLLNMPWVQKELIEGECFCPWVRGNAKKIKNQPPNLLMEESVLEDEVILVADGARLLVHASVVSEKSAKLASAIRFARMNRNENSCDKILHLAVSIPAHFLSLLIQHIYHGSICYSWPNMKDGNMCRYLLEFMLIAEEFLMPSLVQEIEMRLLSSSPKCCFCWHCCQAVRMVSSEINKNVAQCLYCVDGNSRLVTSNSVMDILGITEYMEGLEYGICLAPTSFISINCSEPTKLWKSYDNGIRKHENKIDSWQLNKAVVSLKDTTIIAILKKFASVVKCPDFYLDTEDVLNKEQLLLQMCLNELRNNSIVAASYSKSMRKLLKCNTDSFDDLTVDL